MTQSTSFRLSEEAAIALKELAQRYDVSQSKVLEHLILDRYLASDMRRNIERRNIALNVALEFKSHGAVSMFMAGYKAGWLDFQTRHGKEALVEQMPEE